MAEPRGMEGLRSPRLGRHSSPWAKRVNTQPSLTSPRAQPEAFYREPGNSHGPQSPCHLQGLGTYTSFTFLSVPKSDGGDEARKKWPEHLGPNGLGLLRSSSVEIQVKADGPGASRSQRM